MSKAQDAVQKITDEDDGWEEVNGQGGGDFAPTWDWDTHPVLVATYQSTRTVVTTNGDSLIHHFTDAAGFLSDEDAKANNVACALAEVDSWGTGMLNPRLAEIAAGTKVKVISTGRRIPTKGGKAKEFRVLAAKK